jgi:hypothetical protein
MSRNDLAGGEMEGRGEETGWGWAGWFGISHGQPCPAHHLRKDTSPVRFTVFRIPSSDRRRACSPDHLDASSLVRGLSGPPRGSGAATPQGALRAFDSSARPRLLADLRSAPPAAAI